MIMRVGNYSRKLPFNCIIVFSSHASYTDDPYLAYGFEYHKGNGKGRFHEYPSVIVYVCICTRLYICSRIHPYVTRIYS